MIALENVTHAYSEVPSVEEVTVRVAPGETVALIGPSGCGKSTLLKLAVGLVWPRRGRTVIDDQELRPENVLALRRRIGYVIQSGGLFPHLSAEDNVTLAARYLRRDRSWIE
ncbi:MAG: ATP-binding cassette domain-containing protein, partial [Steroidobacteraceae bacterium]